MFVSLSKMIVALETFITRKEKPRGCIALAGSWLGLPCRAFWKHHQEQEVGTWDVAQR